ncbi:hypothetical protein O181_007697 [Austropuccinia psidii MF-1]|uniref:HPP transmembrane region domain-containing protein n=1 Tax=Austropuccinia psidii MF-1 TaxID=1389203 RepID=A0A9Q3GIR0_9BASI|nr:hypothetical protein [Austropuccinia psidii MF-1]
MNSMLSHLSIPIILGPTGATAVTLFALPHTPAASPRNVLLGYLSGSFFATLMTRLFLQSTEVIGSVNQGKDISPKLWLCGCGAVTLSLAFQRITNSLHPPGGAIALVGTFAPGLVKLGWKYIGCVMTWAGLLLAFSLVFGNIGRRRYPLYWWWPPNN